jgi:hypothetical protein
MRTCRCSACNTDWRTENLSDVTKAPAPSGSGGGGGVSPWSPGGNGLSLGSRSLLTGESSASQTLRRSNPTPFIVAEARTAARVGLDGFDEHAPLRSASDVADGVQLRSYIIRQANRQTARPRANGWSQKRELECQRSLRTLHTCSRLLRLDSNQQPSG